MFVLFRCDECQTERFRIYDTVAHLGNRRFIVRHGSDSGDDTRFTAQIYRIAHTESIHFTKSLFKYSFARFFCEPPFIAFDQVYHSAVPENTDDSVIFGSLIIIESSLERNAFVAYHLLFLSVKGSKRRELAILHAVGKLVFLCSLHDVFSSCKEAYEHVAP